MHPFNYFGAHVLLCIGLAQKQLRYIQAVFQAAAYWKKTESNKEFSAAQKPSCMITLSSKTKSGTKGNKNNQGWSFDASREEKKKVCALFSKHKWKPTLTKTSAWPHALCHIDNSYCSLIKKPLLAELGTLMVPFNSQTFLPKRDEFAC